ncbi:MAG TPA: lytic murein transglycosylase [Solirubrobacteraceae bacterium]
MTVAGLGPLADSALGTGEVTSTTETTTAPTTTTTEAEAPPAEGNQPTTSTSTPSAPPPSPSSSSSSPPTPTPTSPAPSTPAPETTTAVPLPASPKNPVVVLQRRQKTTPGSKANPGLTSTTPGSGATKTSKATGPNNVAASPQAVAQAGALAAMLASSGASAQALDFYRIPLFLLPIYKAAAVQYGVPWQILAAINEIETDYGTDLSVSSAGAVGWMQFMPSTWLQYGVDALNAGYADPYSPVDAIFAAARYLRAAGAATNLRAAILAYNHSEEYADSVLLRAKLISAYPQDVIATLTGLIDGRMPVSGKHVAWHALAPLALSPSSATAGAAAVTPHASSSKAATAPAPGAPLSPASAAAAATAKAAVAAAHSMQLVELTSIPTASVVAVEDGRVLKVGHSRALGRYVILRDVYGDVFTYAGLGSVAKTYAPAKAPRTALKAPGVEAAGTPDPAPVQPASAGSQPPLTLTVKTPTKSTAAAAASHGQATVPNGSEEAASVIGKVRLFAHPGNPDAVASAAAVSKRRARASRTPSRLPLRAGAVVSSGTVLGRVDLPKGAQAGHLRFAIQPAGDQSTIEPGPILDNWAQLQTALHPQGARATNALLGATASDVLLQSKTELQRAVLSDPGISLPACERKYVSTGVLDRRVLAVLAFLSRSGLQPTVAAAHCAHATPGTHPAVDTLEISAINGVKLAHHQGAGTITDLTIRTLLTLPGEFVPQKIISLMRYPGAPRTEAVATSWDRIELQYAPPQSAAKALRPSTVGAASSAKSGRAAPAPRVSTTVLSTTQWNQLLTRVGALPTPKVATKPSSAAIPDPSKPKRP